jgi:hypothetical protein
MMLVLTNRRSIEELIKQIISMKNRGVVLIVKFNSSFGSKHLLWVSQGDIEAFKNMQGLLQTYFVTDELTGAVSVIYIFEHESARTAFWSSTLAKEIPMRYGVIPSTLRIEQYSVTSMLNDLIVA